MVLQDDAAKQLYETKRSQWVAKMQAMKITADARAHPPTDDTTAEELIETLKIISETRMDWVKKHYTESPKRDRK